jgi:transcriptional regulator of arginine metabolism
MSSIDCIFMNGQRQFAKARRQQVILDAISRESIRNQEQLRRGLKSKGFDVTQATLSRDVRELGLMKGGVDGAYQSASLVEPPRWRARELDRAVGEYLVKVDRVEQMVLLRTGPGQAPVMGVALDRARLPEVVGTLAGDDTILVIAQDARRATALIKRLRHHVRRTQ